MKRWPFVVLAVALLALVGVAYAASELTNPGFDGSFSGWTNSGCTWTGSVGHDALGSAYAEYNDYIQESSISLDAGDGVYDVGAWARRYTSGTNGNGAWYLYQYPGGALIRSGSMTPGGTSWTQYHGYAGLDDSYTYLFRLKCTQAGNKVYYDDADFDYGMSFVTVEGNRVENGGMDGGLWGWTTHGATYQASAGNLDYGYMELDVSPEPTHTVEITVTGDYIVGVAAGFHTAGGTNTLYMRVYDDGGTLKKVLRCSEPGSGWNFCSSSYGFVAGDYEVRLDATAKLRVDDVQIVPQFEIASPPDPPTYTAGAYIYYPYLETDRWDTYQSYSETTWYGDPYEAWTIWRLRPGATVYPVATLDIEEVGVNTNGYYIWAWINAWPDVPSTTVRYEGLASVTVAAGQRVGVNCALGTVGVNQTLGEYHLLLYTEFAGSAIDPVPWMTTYPTPGYCNLVDPGQADTIGPGAGEIPDHLIEVCQACAVPTTWSNVGRWVAWLWCQIQNLFTCWLSAWINQIIAMQVMTLERMIGDGNALAAQWNDLMYTTAMSLTRLEDTGDWLAGLTGDAVDYVQAVYLDVGSRLDNLGYIVMSFAGGNSYILNEADTNFWDVLVGMSRLLSGLVELLAGLVDGIFRVLVLLLRLVSDLVSLLVMLISGLISGLAGESEPADLFAVALDLPGNELVCTQEGAFATSGASAAKAACMFLTMLGLFDDTIATSLLRYVPLLFVGILAIGLAFWIAGQFRTISAT